jgi:hypothetical protein
MRYLLICTIVILFTADIFSQPGGEDCSSATQVFSIPFTGTGNTSSAMDDYFESCPDIGNIGGAPEQVYIYSTGNTAEYIDVTLCEAVTDYDSQLYIYENTCNTTPIGCQEDGCQSPAFSAPYNSQLTGVLLQPNTNYYFVIDGYDAGAMGNYQLNIDVSTAFNLPDSSLIPLVYINTSGQSILDEPKISAHMGIIDQGIGNYNYASDPYNEYDGEIGIEIRGSSSATFPKKGYGVETRDGLGANLNVPLFGMPSENDWVFHGPYSDKSLLRNFLAYYLGRQMYYYVPRTQFCELVINNEYKGVYLFTEKIKKDNGRVDISNLDFDDLAGDSLTGGYIIKIDKSTGINNDSWTSPYPTISANPQDIKFLYHYPEADDILTAQKNYIESYVSAFEDVLAGPDFLDPALGYMNYAEINSFVDYYLLTEATKNVDGYRLSTFLYKDKDSKNGKLHIGPPWDYNLGWGNANYCQGGSTTGWMSDFNLFCSGGWEVPFWWERMLSDPEFLNRINCRWQDLREGPFHTDSIFNVIDSVSNLLSAATQRNFNRWNILNTYIWPNNYVGNNYVNELDYLKTWIQNRLQWMDNNLPGNAVDCNFLSADNNLDSSIEVKVIPNPFTDRFYIEVHDLLSNENIIVSVHDLYGKQLYKEIFKTQDHILIDAQNISELDHLSMGVYIIRVSSGDVSKSLKLIKN